MDVGASEASELHEVSSCCVLCPAPGHSAGVVDVGADSPNVRHYGVDSTTRHLQGPAMTIDGALLSPTLMWVLNLFLAAMLLLAARLAPWRKLRQREQLNVFLGTLVALMLLWHMDAQVQPGLSFHLLGVTAITLMFGWSLAVIGTAIVLLGVTINTGAGWEGYAMNAVLSGVVPATLTQILLILIRWYLPKQFFVYVLVNGFLTAGLVGVLTGYLAAFLLVLMGAYSFADLSETVLPFFPLMFMPEAFLNGWILAVLVAFKPEWVYSFSDEQYLKGK
jgi:uncharacterized membrane protein